MEGLESCRAWKLVPIDENGEEISLLEMAHRYDVRTGRI